MKPDAHSRVALLWHICCLSVQHWLTAFREIMHIEDRCFTMDAVMNLWMCIYRLCKKMDKKKRDKE